MARAQLKPYDSSQLIPPSPLVEKGAAPRRARTPSACLSVRCMHELPGLPESRASCARSWYLSDQSDLEHVLTWLGGLGLSLGLGKPYMCMHMTCACT
jgi:hypothetical protein